MRAPNFQWPMVSAELALLERTARCSLESAREHREFLAELWRGELRTNEAIDWLIDEAASGQDPVVHAGTSTCVEDMKYESNLQDKAADVPLTFYGRTEDKRHGTVYGTLLGMVQDRVLDCVVAGSAETVLDAYMALLLGWGRQYQNALAQLYTWAEDNGVADKADDLDDLATSLAEDLDRWGMDEGVRQ